MNTEIYVCIQYCVVNLACTHSVFVLIIIKFYVKIMIYECIQLKSYFFIVIWENDGITYNCLRKCQCCGENLPNFMDLILTYHGNNQ